MSEQNDNTEVEDEKKLRIYTPSINENLKMSCTGSDEDQNKIHTGAHHSE